LATSLIAMILQPFQFTFFHFQATQAGSIVHSLAHSAWVAVNSFLNSYSLGTVFSWEQSTGAMVGGAVGAAVVGTVGAAVGTVGAAVVCDGVDGADVGGGFEVSSPMFQEELVGGSQVLRLESWDINHPFCMK